MDYFASEHRFVTNNNTERMRILANGNVGIGTTSPSELLHIGGHMALDSGGASNILRTPSGYLDLRPSHTSHGIILRDYTGGSTSWAGIRSSAAGDLQMTSSGSYDDFNITTAGNVGIGRTNPTAALHIDRSLGDGDPIIGIAAHRNYGVYRRGANASSANLSFESLVNGNSIQFAHAGSRIVEFNTGGDVNVSNNINIDGTGDADIFVADAIRFRNTNTGGSSVCYVSAGGYSIRRCSSSSERYKNTISTANFGLNQIRQMRPVTYFYNDGYSSDTGKQFGFIAEEMAAIDPMFARYDKNNLPEDVQYKNLTAVLARGIQQLDTRTQNQQSAISSLQTQVNTKATKIAHNNLRNRVTQAEATIGDLVVASSSYLQNGDSVNFSSLNVSGPTTLSNLTVTGNATIKGNLTVEGELSVNVASVDTTLTLGSHVYSAGEVPTIEALTAAGQEAEVEIDGTDTAGTITVRIKAYEPDEAELQNGAEPEALTAGELLDILFVNEYSHTPRVVISPLNLESSRLLPFVEQGTDGFKLVIGEPAEDGVEYKFNYVIVGSDTVSQQ